MTSGNSAQPEQVRTELAQEQKILKFSLVQKMAESSGDEGAANTLGGPVTPGPELVACIQRIVAEAMNIASAESGTSTSRRPGSLPDGGTEAGGYPQCIVALWLLEFGRQRSTTHAAP